MYDEILKKAFETHSLTADEIIVLLKSNDDKVLRLADETRKEYKGNTVHLRALIEFSNICRCNCFYCGLRRENKKIERYSMSNEDIIRLGETAVKSGYKTLVLQSGEDVSFTCDRICSIIKELKKFDIAITLSIGERSYEEYKAFKESGADRYLLRIETTDEYLYKKLHPGMSIKNRLECLYNLKKLGYETGTGIIAGLPGQTDESIAKDILFFKNLDADMIGIGPLIPHPETPLKDADKDNFKKALQVTAITRLLMPDINIPATTAMESLRKNGRIIALQSGANVVMPNMTETECRGKYEIYPQKANIEDTPEQCTKNIKKEITSIGRTVSLSKGFRYDKN